MRIYRYLDAKAFRDEADKLKVAASLHRQSMREYMVDVLQAHLKELERKGVTLTLPKGK